MRVKSIRVPVTRLESSIIHYEEYMGLTRLEVNHKRRTAAFHASLTHGPDVQLVETTAVPPLHFPIGGGHFQPYFRFHSSDLEGVYRRLHDSNVRLTPIHWDYPSDGCGKFFEAADPDGSFVQFHVNEDEKPASYSTVETLLNMEIPVTDVKRSAEFYNRIGFSLDQDPREDIAFLSTGNKIDWLWYGKQNEFGLIVVKQDQFPVMRFHKDGQSEAMLLLETDELETYSAYLQQQGVDCSRHSAELLRFSDPDGHLWFVQQAAKARLVSQERVKSEILIGKDT